MSKDNLKVNHRKYQAFRLKDFTLEESVKNNPLKTLTDKSVLTRAERVVFNCLVGFANNHQHIFPSIETLAEKSGCSPRTVSNAIRKFKDLGIIETYSRYNNSSIRRLNRFFFDPDVRKQLRGFFYAFRYAFIVSLTTYAAESIALQKAQQIVQQQEKCKLNTNAVYLKESKSISRERESTNYAGNFQPVGQLVELFKRVTPKPTGAVRPITKSPYEFTPMAPKKGKVVKIEAKLPNDQPMKDSECLKQLKNITSANLWGQIIMTAFHPKVLTQVIKKMNAGKGVGTDSYTVFFRNCVYYSNARKLPIDRERVRNLARKHGMPEEPNYADGRERRTDDVKIDALWKENSGEDI